MALIADGKADQQGGDLFEDARVFQFAAVESANAGNFCRELTDGFGRGRIVTANDDVAIDRAV